MMMGTEMIPPEALPVKPTLSMRELLEAARKGRKGGSLGSNLVRSIVENLEDTETRYSLATALIEYDVSRRCWRVSARQISDILGQFGTKISPATVTLWRKTNEIRTKTENSVPLSEMLDLLMSESDVAVCCALGMSPDGV